MIEMHLDQTSVTELVTAARGGDHSAWATIVTRYEPLVLSIARRYRLSHHDVEDVSQTVWLQLVSGVERLREPRALPGWIETTTANSCMAVLRRLRRTVPQDPPVLDGIAEFPTREGSWPSHELDEALLRSESRRAVWRGLAELSSKERALLVLLAADPPLSYRQISDRVGMPVGSIGPTRARSLAKLRNTRSVRSILAADDSTTAA
jgi:RNA polymerase sigma factor (sigma-70 family)